MPARGTRGSNPTLSVTKSARSPSLWTAARTIGTGFLAGLKCLSSNALIRVLRNVLRAKIPVFRPVAKRLLSGSEVIHGR